MKNERLTNEQKLEILRLRGEGMRAPQIAQQMNLSESGVYRVIQMDRIKEKPIVDDSKVVQELKAKIEELEQKNKALEETNARLVKIIEKLTD